MTCIEILKFCRIEDIGLNLLWIIWFDLRVVANLKNLRMRVRFWCFPCASLSGKCSPCVCRAQVLSLCLHIWQHATHCVLDCPGRWEGSALRQQGRRRIFAELA